MEIISAFLAAVSECLFAIYFVLTDRAQLILLHFLANVFSAEWVEVLCEIGFFALRVIAISIIGTCMQIISLPRFFLSLF